MATGAGGRTTHRYTTACYRGPCRTRAVTSVCGRDLVFEDAYKMKITYMTQLYISHSLRPRPLRSHSELFSVIRLRRLNSPSE